MDIPNGTRALTLPTQRGTRAASNGTIEGVPFRFIARRSDA